MTHHRRPLALLLCGVVFGWLSASRAVAQAVPNDARRIEHPAIQGGKVFRVEKRLIIVPDKLTDAGSVTIPRICGALRAIGWLNKSDASAVSVQPEPAVWTVEWRTLPAGAEAIVLDFDQAPKLPSELEPAVAAGDGSIMLPAYQARTAGEKLRYEPQPFKNTIGYWTVPTDTASWKLRIDTAGEFNVGILQGCGAGHGGSRASLHLQKEAETIAMLEFEVLETGHFQNFQWRHFGKLPMLESGDYTLTITPTEIAHGALMDVRSVHLVRLPSAAKQ